MFQAKVVEKIKTHILCSVTFFSLNRAVYERMWKNISEPDRPQATWRMRIDCMLNKTANTHSEHVIPTAFPQQQWLHEHALHVHCLSCYLSGTGTHSKGKRANNFGRSFFIFLTGKSAKGRHFVTCIDCRCQPWNLCPQQNLWYRIGSDGPLEASCRKGLTVLWRTADANPWSACNMLFTHRVHKFKLHKSWVM